MFEKAAAAAARRASELGCGGMLCIHPAQVAVVRVSFRPTEDEVDCARRIVDAGSRTVQVDGAMADAPVVGRARRILVRHGANGG